MSDHVVKTGVMADSERDTASCSGGEEDSRSGLHSPSASEDSVEVQVTPISLRNKRKLAEPRKIQEPSTAPLKKRRFHQIEETVVVDEESRSLSTPSPFRPWIIPHTSNETSRTSSLTSTSSVSSTATTTTTTTTTMPPSMSPTLPISSASPTKATPEEDVEQPHVEAELIKHDETRNQDETIQRLQSLQRIQQTVNHNRTVVQSRREPRQRFEPPPPSSPVTSTPVFLPHPRLQDEPLSLVMRDEAPRVPSHPAVSGGYEKTPSYMMEHLLASSSTSSSSQSHRNHRNHLSPQQTQQRHQMTTTTTTTTTTTMTTTTSSSSSSHTSSRHHHQGGGGSGSGSGGQQRNYKNMTRERRMEANARERTRVHTISAAFDTLRRAIPAYSHNQKLSKLSVLRIACSYIATLTKIRKTLEGEATSGASLAACVDQVSRTIQTEGKLRKRKDD